MIETINVIEYTELVVVMQKAEIDGTKSGAAVDKQIALLEDDDIVELDETDE
ncbi:MAG: hypothetical protein LIO86_00190 [Lachnospiraceae bacterium]|nr:hypothetical protein [Lachnospiraceae bacterium]